MERSIRPITLSYRASGQDPLHSRWDPLWASLLALPGVAGFALLAGALLFDSSLAWHIGPRRGVCLWALAFVCAICSFFYFHRRRKSVSIKLCLFLNWTGVIFTITPPGWVILILAIQ